MKKEIVPAAQIAQSIHFLRGQRVLLDFDLAALYGVITGNLNKAVKRNSERFPADFMIRLTTDEVEILVFQIGISSWGGRRGTPYVFTEQGVAMLSSVLRSERAVNEIAAIIDAIRQLMAPPAKPGREIGFHMQETAPRYGKRKRV